MENNKIAVGLDIGTTKIVAMIGRRHFSDNPDTFPDTMNNVIAYKYYAL